MNGHSKEGWVRASQVEIAAKAKVLSQERVLMGSEELKRGEKNISKMKKGKRGVRSGQEGRVTGIRSGQTL